MPTVRLRCPTCRAEVELGREFLGAEVECGACLAVFVADPRAATDPPPPPAEQSRTPGGDAPGPRRPQPSRRPRPRRDYPRPPADPEPPASAAAVASLVLGITSVMTACCSCVSIPFAVGAMATGGTALMGRGGHGIATAGLILGIVGLLLSGAAAAFGFGGNLFNLGR